MIFFYAPWCPHCQNFEPEYQSAADDLKKENIYLAKIDGSTDKKASQKYKVSGYPSILFFINEEPIEFEGGRTKKELINWIKKKIGKAIEIFNEKKDIEQFKKDNEICLIYFGDDENEIRTFEKASKLIEDFPFAVVKNEMLIKKYTHKSTILLFKHFDEKKNELRQINLEKISAFVKKYALPKVLVLNDKSVQYIFQKKKSGFNFVC